MYEVKCNESVIGTAESFVECQGIFRDFIGRPINMQEWRTMRLRGLTIDRKRYSVDYVTAEVLAAA